MGGKEGADAPHQVVVAGLVGPEDHFAVIVAFQIADLAQQGDGVVAGGEAFGLPCGGERADDKEFDLINLAKAQDSRNPGCIF